jgi:ABC-type glycerol-3-phosphate transport system substrate-binding protein
MSRTLALALIAASLLAGCGGGDDDKSSGGKAKPPTTPTATTGTGSQSAKAITSCLKGKGLNVIVNPGSVVDADYQLVINSGGAGVLYGFADESAAKSARGKVLKYEGSSDRKVEVIGRTAYAVYPPGHTFGQPDKSKQVRACAAG